MTGADYPAVVPVQDLPPNMAAKLSPTDKVVRGTYVTGLSDADVEALDVFEGDVSRAYSATGTALQSS